MASSTPESFSLTRYIDKVDHVETIPPQGRVVRTVAALMQPAGTRASPGGVCGIVGGSGPAPLPVQVVGFREGILLSVPLGDTAGVRPGDRVVARSGAVSVGVGQGLLGRVVDALGRPLDGAPLRLEQKYPLHPAPLNPMARDPVVAPLATGVRTIDALLTCGRGQRVGLFGGSGVGKSTLLGMLTRGTVADVAVLASDGDLGRHVRGFIAHNLEPEGLSRL